jgi:hypothetical protein
MTLAKLRWSVSRSERWNAARQVVWSKQLS